MTRKEIAQYLAEILTPLRDGNPTIDKICDALWDAAFDEEVSDGPR